MAQRVVHRFLRQPNMDSSIYNRVANRFKPFENTLTILDDPQSNRQLYLIGTTNSSTTLAHRTRKLIEEIKPSSVYVQTSNLWWNHAKHVDVANQQQFSQISRNFPTDNYEFENNPRGILWRLRYYTWAGIMKLAVNFPSQFAPFTPGLQMKYAIQQAEKVGAKVHYGEVQFDPVTMNGLKGQPDMYAHVALWRARKFYQSQSAWASQYHDFKTTLHCRGGQAFAESFDRSRANFMVQLLNKVAPKQKRILVDLRDERIFRDLYKNCEGDKIMAVVNQWHCHGVQTHWRRRTGTQIQDPQQSPIADMNIDEYQQRHLINEFLREYTSKVTKSEPATHQDMLTNYHKQNFEYERTRHTHHDSHQDIPAPGQEKKHHH